MELHGFYKEETLNELLQENKISRLEYIYHHSQEMKEDFEQFCKERELSQNNEAAQQFAEYRLDLEDTADI